MVTTVRVGAHTIGAGRCFVIAEAGVNHNGDPALAHRLVDAAVEAGVDAVKFQTFVPELVASRDAAKAEYQAERTGAGQSQLDMLRALALPPAAYRELMAHAAERGLLFLSTPFDDPSADLLAELGLPAFKIASGELTNHPFLSRVAAFGRPMLLSSGMATLEEVGAALAAVRAVDGGGPPVALFHCVSNYPTAPGDCNLRAMDTMRAAFGVPTGWSDHTDGLTVSVAAAARGADLLEKHFTLDRRLPGPDHQASLEPGELAELVRQVRTVEAAMGSGEKRPAASEAAVAAVARRSLHARASLPAGHRLAPADLLAVRPGTGIPPSRAAQLVGRRLRRAVGAGEMLREDDLEA